MYPYLQAAKDVSYLFLISFVMYFLSFPFMYHLALAVESNTLQHNLQCAQFINSRTRNIQPTRLPSKLGERRRHRAYRYQHVTPYVYWFRVWLRYKLREDLSNFLKQLHIL